MKPIPESTHAPQLAEERSTHAATLGALFMRASHVHTGPALRYKEGERWVDISFHEFGERARDIARGLIALGVEPGDRVAILSDTRPEWTIADAGVMCAGAVAVPVYQTNSAGECQYVLEHSDARVVLCENPAQAEKVTSVRGRCPMLDEIVVMEGRAPGTITLPELRARGATISGDSVDRRVRDTEPGDLATIVYTSGATGPPKGCMLSHANLIATVRMYEHRLELDGSVVIFIFLPLAHSLARVTQLVTLDVGGTLAFWQRDPARLLDDIRESRPTHLPSVPRVFEKIHTAADAGIAELSPIKRAVFKRAISTGRRVRKLERSGHRPNGLLRRQHALADRLALSKVRKLFGDNLQLALTGAAPIAHEVLEFFDACGVLVVEGYGMTESCAASTLNTPHELRFGSVGRPLPGTEVKVAEDGELLMRGPHVFLGYFKDPAATTDTLDADGWLLTGDLGEVSDDGFVSITGRKKDIIITSSGKNITPTNIENELKTSRWIAEAVVYGDGHPYLVALLTLDPDELPALAELTAAPAEPSYMAADPRVRELIQGEVDAVNERFARIEQVKRFAILDHDLSQEAGELTPTLKVKRNVVYDRYGETLAALYASEREE